MQRRFLTAVVCLTLGIACARSDLGSPCHLQDANGGEITAQPGRDYIYLGSGECESFSCIATTGSQGGYCSQPCAGAGAACPSGMSCSLLSFSPQYLDVMKATLPPDRYQQLFGQLNGSWYCTKSR